MKELSENLFKPILIILIICAFFIHYNKETWSNYFENAEFQSAYDTSILSPDAIDLTQHNSSSSPSDNVSEKIKYNALV